MTKIQFGADKVKVSGPMADGSYTATFYTGEYEKNKIAQLVMIESHEPLRVTVEPYDPDKG